MTRWGKIGLSLCAVLALSVSAGPVSADLMTFEVIPAYAPKGTESPSWSNYVFNAIAGIQLGANLGDRSTDPTAYERVSGPIPASEIVYTPFKSWRGTADPNPAFVAPFRGEFGNRVHFGLRVIGTAEWDFALDEMTWELESDDQDGYFNQSGDFVGADYSATRVGINYGGDGMKGGGDDVIISSGPGTQRVHELIYVGVGDGFLSFDPAAADDQSDINATLADLAAGCTDLSDCFVNLKATYTLPDHAGAPVAAMGDVKINLVPEPATSLLGGVGLVVSLATFRRRRRSLTNPIV